MKSIAYITTALLLFNTSIELKAVSKNQALDTFIIANEYYKDSKFKQALNAYRWLLDVGYESADLYYNMGNAYYKNDSLPLSIWSFEKALLLNPNFEEARRNLEIANLSVADKVQDLPRVAWWHYWQNFKRLFTVAGWTIISIIFLWIVATGLFLLLSLKTHWVKRLGVYLIFVGLFFAIVSMAIAANKSYQLRHPNSAIIVTSNVYAKSAPEESSGDLFVIHSGLKVKCEDEIGDWIKVKLADGKMGWVQANDLKSL